MALGYRQGYLHPRFWPTWLLLGGARLVSLIPQRPGISVGRFFGRLAYRVAGRRRRIAATNLALCFPELDEIARQRLLRQHFASLGMALVETAYCWYLSPNQLLRRVYEVQGEAHFQAALALGRGVILLAAHFTHLEIGSTLLGLRYTGAAVYRPHGNPLLEAVIQYRRGRHNVASTLIAKTDPRGMLRVLREKHFLWYAADQDYRADTTVFVPFFGIVAATNPAIIRLARLSGAPVVPFYQQRLADGSGYRLGFLPPLASPNEVNSAEDYMTEVHRLLEQLIRQMPEDYLWVHRRFKTRPPGDLHPIYPKSA